MRRTMMMIEQTAIGGMMTMTGIQAAAKVHLLMMIAMRMIATRMIATKAATKDLVKTETRDIMMSAMRMIMTIVGCHAQLTSNMEAE